jgi:uncharacterized protein (TIGR00369 family)
VTLSDGSKPRDRAETLRILQGAFRDFIPHNAALGMDVVDFGDSSVVLKLPYDPQWIGNPATGTLHGGVITALLDAASGAAVYMRLGSPVPIATLDLRIDYLKPGTTGRDVFARAECYKLTRSVAFVRGFAYHDDERDPIAATSSTFMLHTKGNPLRSPR